MEQEKQPKSSGRPRGRPTKYKAFLAEKAPGAAQVGQHSTSSEDTAAIAAESIVSQGRYPGAFATLLSFLIKNDRREILRIARAIDVSDNTVYRWLNGTSEPRPGHLERLLEVLPQPQQRRAFVPGETVYREQAQNITGHVSSGEVQREIFHRVLEQVAFAAADSSRRWHITRTIFEYALLHLDPGRQGMALTYARLMLPQADGTIHSLCEAEMLGQAPWNSALEYKAYLGSTTLAGSAAIFQRVRTWCCKDSAVRVPVGLDKNERSSCAAPVMRGGCLAGVLIVSSTQPDFVRNPVIPGAVSDYANILATGLADCEFYPRNLLKLVPMPELDWQRDNIARTYLNRVFECARMDGLSFPEAERKVLRDLEKEFECHASTPENGQSRSVPAW